LNDPSQKSSVETEVEFFTLLLLPHICQPLIPEFSGRVPETDLTSCCPGSIQRCPRKYSCGKRIY